MTVQGGFGNWEVVRKDLEGEVCQEGENVGLGAEVCL